MVKRFILESSIEVDWRPYAPSLDPEAISGSPAKPLFEMLGRFDRQVIEGLELGAGWDLPKPAPDFSNILFCGMGGSAIGGDLLAAYLAPTLSVPISVNRSGSIPNWVNSRSLVVVCSYSGNTAETLRALELARERGACILGLSAGGELAKRAKEWGFPRVKVPPGLPPRVALIYGMIPTLVGLSRLGLCADCSAEVRGSIQAVKSWGRSWGPSVALPENVAKSIAVQLLGRFPVVIGSANGLDVLARRWAGQFCENAKQLAFFSSLPEAAHNEVVGWLEGGLDSNQPLAAVWLLDRDDPSHVRRQREWIGARMKELGLPQIQVVSQGESRLERLWSLLLLGDYASLYLAVLRGRDPLPVASIEQMKRQIAAP